MQGRVRFHHVSLVVSNVSLALEFYHDLLALEILERPEMSFDGAWLSLGSGLQLHLLQVPNPDDTEGRPEHGGRDRHVALCVSDLGWYEQRLRSSGVPFTRSASGREALFCRDPDGNALELMAF